MPSKMQNAQKWMGSRSPFVSDERREKKRFRMEREVRYRILNQDRTFAFGVGETIYVSSIGVAFTNEIELPVGVTIELSIDWPALIDNICRLQLVGCGHVLRSSGGITVCTLAQHDFRTLGRGLHFPGMTRHDGAGKVPSNYGGESQSA